MSDPLRALTVQSQYSILGGIQYGFQTTLPNDHYPLKQRQLTTEQIHLSTELICSYLKPEYNHS
jgi:hypothetical protein